MGIYLDFTVEGQILIKNDSMLLYTKQQNYIKARFSFDSAWDGISNRKALFSSFDQPVTAVLLDAYNCAVIPWEHLQNAGTLTVSVCGGDRMTTSSVDVTVLASGYDDESVSPLEPTPDLSTQIETMARNAADSAALAKQAVSQLEGKLDAKVNKRDGMDLSSNDYTDDDKARMQVLKDTTELKLYDSYGNSYILKSDSSVIADTSMISIMEGNNKMGYKISPTVLFTAAGGARGGTLSLQRRLNQNDQTLISYMITTGMLEIRTGVTAGLDNSSSGVATTFSKAMSGVPDIILLQPNSGQAGIAAPKIVSKSTSGFSATLGGSSGGGTVCSYIAIKFNYMNNQIG